MEKKKRYIIILIILIIFFLLMYFLIAKGELKKGKIATTIIIGDNTIWNYSDKTWLNITNDKTISSLNWLDYTVYLDNKKFGNYYLWRNDNKWYAFDNDKKAITTEGNIIAYRSNYEIKIQDFNTTPINDYTYVDQVLRENNLSSQRLTVSSQISFDMDNDGNKENLYLISNAFPIDSYPNKIFTFVFMVKDGKIELLYKDIDDNRTNNGCRPYLSAIIDVDDDNTYELVVSCGKYSIEKPVDMLYKLTNEGFKILISNQ